MWWGDKQCKGIVKFSIVKAQSRKVTPRFGIVWFRDVL